MMTLWTHHPREGRVVAAALTAFLMPGRPTLPSWIYRMTSPRFYGEELA